MDKKSTKDTKSFRVNDEIPSYYKEVRIVGDDIESKVVTLSKAKEMADKMEMDLIEINSNVNPPIIRIADYGKFTYELKKKAKNKKSATSQLKEVQLKTNIAKHDLETKANQAKRFLSNGDKVKVVLTMKGRELTRREESKKAIYEFIVMLDENAVVEMLKDENNRTIAILRKK